MTITFQSIFKLASILAPVSTMLLLILGMIGTVEIPTPALIILTSISVAVVSMALVLNKGKSIQ